LGTAFPKEPSGAKGSSPASPRGLGKRVHVAEGSSSKAKELFTQCLGNQRGQCGDMHRLSSEGRKTYKPYESRDVLFSALYWDLSLRTEPAYGQTACKYLKELWVAVTASSSSSVCPTSEAMHAPPLSKSQIKRGSCCLAQESIALAPACDTRGN
jgi:hypothetical protein